MRLPDGITRLLLSFEQLQALYLLIPPNFFYSIKETAAYMKGRAGGGFWIGKGEFLEITPEAEQMPGEERARAYY